MPGCTRRAISSSGARTATWSTSDASDNQVKIRGFRIELGEVEAAVQQAPGVKEAAVIVREDEPGDKRLAAYVVATDGSNLNLATLRQVMKERLPGYMVPSAFVFLDSLPLTPNGKVDRKALAALPAPDHTGVNDYVAPRNPAEELMAGIWRELLRLSRVSVEENFFELGGHSLLAAQLVSRIRQVFGKTVPVRMVFEAPTVAELTKRVQSTSDAEATERIPLADRSRELPLSYSQEQLWLIDQMEPGTALYNVPVVWRLRGELKVDALEQAIQGVVKRHESLRTVFAMGADGRPVQVIHPYEPSVLPVDDCTDEKLAPGLVSEEIHRPFDLTTGPLWRARLIRLGDEEHLFLFTMHHVVSDGWSMGVFTEELKSLYTRICAGRGKSPSAIVHPICRLRGMAEGVARERGAGATVGLLAGEAGWRVATAAVAHGPTASGAADLPRCGTPASRSAPGCWNNCGRCPNVKGRHCS